MCARDQSRALALADRSIGSITMCGCGTIHVAVGSVTLRLAPDAFCELVVLCQSAANQLVLQAKQDEAWTEDVVN